MNQKSTATLRVDDLYNKVDMSEPSLLTDFSRLARWITGTSVGLVLGGGGARGGAHVGMIKVLLEARIPIDLIGGVSIGSLVSALWAMSRNIDEVTSSMAGWSDVLKALGAKLVIAVDVGSQDETDLFDYGDFLSGWWVLLRKLSPFHDTIKVLSAAEIESRIAYVCCSRQLQEVKNSDYCKYIRPPIDKYSTFQFRAFEQIKDIGYQHGKTIFPDEAAGKAFLAEGLPNKKCSSHMFTSYVDLAEKMYKKKPNNLTGTTVVEEEEISIGNDSDDEYDEIDDGTKQLAPKAKKKVKSRRLTPPPMSVSNLSLFGHERKHRLSHISSPSQNRLNNLSQEAFKLGRLSDNRLKARSGAASRAIYRSKSMSKANAKRISVAEAKPCLSDLDVPCEERLGWEVKSEPELAGSSHVIDERSSETKQNETKCDLPNSEPSKVRFESVKSEPELSISNQEQDGSEQELSLQSSEPILSLQSSEPALSLQSSELSNSLNQPRNRDAKSDSNLPKADANGTSTESRNLISEQA
ncbi:neuropathy target esterase sws-like [Diaphorina citri]|uniref:lysophospholipase n=1 Tax=Diaphorina citri TaxID=121845 RepID=A0A3Q0JG79_DIACI|nr:neuropathy target esterase sws-like [Diaphorina citri]